MKEVKGIGAKRFDKLKPDLAVSGPSTLKQTGKPEAKQPPSRSAQDEVTAARRDSLGAAAGKP